MPVRCVTQFLSNRQNSSPMAHHRASRTKQDVSSTHDIAGIDEPRFHSMIVLVHESVAKMLKTALRYRRPADATRRSAPPAVSSDCQPLGTIDSAVVITIDCEWNCSALERFTEDYCWQQHKLGVLRTCSFNERSIGARIRATWPACSQILPQNTPAAVWTLQFRAAPATNSSAGEQPVSRFATGHTPARTSSISKAVRR
jgi:hypothetical protein